MFVGRESELQYLNQYYDRVGSQMIVMYGQRGIGKTTLIRHFLEKKQYFYYEAVSCSTRQHLMFMGQQLQEMGMDMPEFPDYNDIFRFFERETAYKQILVLDEFQNLCKQDMEFLYALARFMNEHQKNLFILLCSSSIGWVENAMIGKMGGLATGITGFLKIRELKYADFVKCNPKYSLQDSVALYSILGGVPELWNCFSDEVNLEENIVSTILNPNSILYGYGERYVSEELREINVYNTILYCLATGKNKLNDLYHYTQFSRAKLSVYIKNLMELEIVEKVFSYDTEGRDNAQKGIYQIQNHMVHFYYRYIYGNMPKFKSHSETAFYKQFVEPTLMEFAEPSFSQLCREYLEAENQRKQLPIPLTKMGKWVGKAGTIDVIGENDLGQTIAGFCCWEKNRMSMEDYEWLQYCFKQAKIRPAYVYLFARNFEEAIQLEAGRNKAIKLITFEA
ncbi:MAG: ATP-binding protein [Lachnospiraceae bacterium]|nr:ATP-binding protein [Lachnospiraceae bacterium]